MRRSILLALVPLALACGIAAAPAASVKLTHQQVDTVCGDDKKNYNNGVSGCAKACGYPEKNQTCVYTCYEKTGMCDGFVASQGAAASGRVLRPGASTGAGVFQRVR